MKRKWIILAAAALCAVTLAIAWFRPMVRVKVTRGFGRPDIRLVTAIRDGGSVGEISRLLNENPEWVHSFSFDGRRPIHLAAEVGRGDVLKLLISRGVDVNIRTDGKPEFRETALTFAIGFGNPEAVSVLVENGADLTARNQFGESALEFAERLGDQRIVQIIRNSMRKPRGNEARP